MGNPSSPLGAIFRGIQRAAIDRANAAGPIAVPPAPDISDADIIAAGDAARAAAAAARGRQSTILTSGLGATDALQTKKKTLLGA